MKGQKEAITVLIQNRETPQCYGRVVKRNFPASSFHTSSVFYVYCLFLLNRGTISNTFSLRFSKDIRSNWENCGQKYTLCLVDGPNSQASKSKSAGEKADLLFLYHTSWFSDPFVSKSFSLNLFSSPFFPPQCFLLSSLTVLRLPSVPPFSSLSSVLCHPFPLPTAHP